MSKKFNIHEWQAKQRRLKEERSQESMSNADIRALQTVVGEYSLNKVLNTISVIADRIGKHDEADMIKNLASKIDDYEDLSLEPEEEDSYRDMIQGKYSDDDLKLEPELDEASTTGGGTSFQAGAGAGYATPYAFKKKRKDN